MITCIVVNSNMSRKLLILQDVTVPFTDVPSSNAHKNIGTLAGT